MLCGLILGVAVTIGSVFVTGEWYEYHMLVAGDAKPWDLVNRDGWELIIFQATQSIDVWFFRRPRFRLHF